MTNFKWNRDRWYFFEWKRSDWNIHYHATINNNLTANTSYRNSDILFIRSFIWSSMHPEFSWSNTETAVKKDEKNGERGVYGPISDFTSICMKHHGLYFISWIKKGRFWQFLPSKLISNSKKNYSKINFVFNTPRSISFFPLVLPVLGLVSRI